MITPYSIKPAELSDIPDIARVHVTSWQQSYADIISQDYLDTLKTEKRAETWREIFTTLESNKSHLWIAQDDKSTVGFISFGPSRDHKWLKVGEIYAIYVLDRVKGNGIGYALFQKAQSIFKDMGFSRSFAYVIKDNQRARESYERWGGQIDEENDKNVKIGGHHHIEIPVWFDLIGRSQNPEPSYEIPQL